MAAKLRIAMLTTDGRGMSAKWAGSTPSIGTAPKALLEGFPELEDVEVHVVYCLRESMPNPATLGPGVYLHQLVVPKWGWMSTLYLGCIKAVQSCLADLRPDIVHGQGTERNCAMEAVYSGFPNVVTIHGIMLEMQRLGFHGHALYGRMASVLESHVLRRTSGVFCNSAYTQSLIAPRARRTWMVPNPIRSAFFGPRLVRPPAGSVPRLLNVGLVSPRKRQLEVLRMMGGIFRSGFPLHIVFAGDLGEATEYGAAFARELRVAEKEGYASYAGVVDETALVALMDQSNGFVHFPSEESFGLVVAEALARGLKFFGANLGGIIDIAGGVEGAELHDNFESLRDGIIAWLGAGVPAPASAAAEIAARYHPTVIARRHVEIYREVLGK